MNIIIASVGRNGKTSLERERVFEQILNDIKVKLINDKAIKEDAE